MTGAQPFGDPAGQSTVLGNRYRLIRPIGSGGMAVVWEARDEVLNRTVAVKVLAGKHLGDPQSRELIRREAQAAAALSHPNIAQVHDYGETATSSGVFPYVVMELIRGETLLTRASRVAVGPRFAMRVCAEVSAALAAAHSEGIVHRDVKPANVMLAATGAKVVDFGIAAAVAPGRTDEDFEVLGTPAYLAPERLLSDVVEPASDVYALAILLYQLLAGCLPWSTETTTQMLTAHMYIEPVPLGPTDGVPDYVVTMCNRSLAKDPTLRPSAREMAAVLAHAARVRVATGDPSADEAASDAHPHPSAANGAWAASEAWAAAGEAPSGGNPAWPTSGDAPSGGNPAWPDASSAPSGGNAGWPVAGGPPSGANAAWPASGGTPSGANAAWPASGSAPSGGNPAWPASGGAPSGGNPAWPLASGAPSGGNPAWPGAGGPPSGGNPAWPGAGEAPSGAQSAPPAGGAPWAAADSPAPEAPVFDPAAGADTAGRSGAQLSGPAHAGVAGRPEDQSTVETPGRPDNRRPSGVRRWVVAGATAVLLFLAGWALWLHGGNGTAADPRGGAGSTLPVAPGAGAGTSPSATPSRAGPGPEVTGRPTDSATGRPTTRTSAPKVGAPTTPVRTGDPTTTPPPTAGDPTAVTLDSEAGTVTATCPTAGTAQIGSVSPLKPWKLLTVDTTPGPAPAAVFKHGKQRVTMTVSCQGGTPSTANTYTS